MGFYVYRFKDKDDEIIYVGKTSHDMPTRIKGHFFGGHLGFDKYVLIDKIEYVEVNSRADMDIRELYYINKWQPEFNTSNKDTDGINMELLTNDVWLDFDYSDIELKKRNALKKLNDQELIASLKEELRLASVKLSHIHSDKKYRMNKVGRKIKRKYQKELSELQSYIDKNKELERLIKFYETKTDNKFKHLYNN